MNQLPSGPAAEICEGFVLAGGRSSRMGRDKSLIDFNGAPLVRYAMEILRASGLDPKIAGARADLSGFAPTIADDPAYPGLGPLSGICPALDSIATRFAVFIPVDMPLLPPRLIEYLVHHAGITGSVITMASLSSFIETFPVVIDRAAAPMLKGSLRSDDRKCLTAFRAAAQALSRPISILPVELLLQVGQVQDCRGLSPQAWFLSVNTPADLSRAEDLARRHPSNTVQ